MELPILVKACDFYNPSINPFWIVDCLFLQFVQIQTLDLFGLNTEIFQGFSLAAVIESYHQLGNSSLEGDPLVITKGLSQGVCSIVAPEVDSLAPGFNQPVN